MITQKKDPVFKISISGSLDASAKIIVGWDLFASIEPEVSGTIISANANGNIYKNGDKDYDGKIGGGPVKICFKGKTFTQTIFEETYQILPKW